jgi:hypothetical protein
MRYAIEAKRRFCAAHALSDVGAAKAGAETNSAAAATTIAKAHLKVFDIIRRFNLKQLLCGTTARTAIPLAQMIHSYILDINR